MFLELINTVRTAEVYTKFIALEKLKKLVYENPFNEMFCLFCGLFCLGSPVWPLVNTR